MSNLAEKLPEEIETQAMTLYEQALSIQVIDQDTFKAAGEFGKSLKALQKSIEDYFEDSIKKAHAAHKSLVALRDKELKPVLEAMSTLRTGMNKFLQDQERIRQEEERKRRLEEEERARKERERLEAQAVKAIAAGKDEKADSLLEQAENVYVAPVTVAPKVETARFDGGNVGQVKELQITVLDAKAFLNALCSRGMSPTMIEIKAAPLKAWVKANDLKSFPGLAIVETVAARIR